MGRLKPAGRGVLFSVPPQVTLKSLSRRHDGMISLISHDRQIPKSLCGIQVTTDVNDLVLSP